MTRLKTAAFSLATLALLGGAAYAQDSMTHNDMTNGMSKHDMMMMKKCQGMDHDMMMKNKGCMKMMKMHPDMMSDGGMVKH